MNIKQTTTLSIILSLFALHSLAQTENLPIASGKFKPDDESLKKYAYPAWFRDAKFGIWAHWGPQAVPRQGDWYARIMYEPATYNCEKQEYKKATRIYSWNLEHYGHPSQFGYKDIIPLWKAERFNPDELMKLYRRVGAKYFVSMGTHHDNFFLWNSRLHRWNSVNMGPKKDIVALWQAAAKKEGLYFGVSEHLGASYTWFQVAHNADQLGDKAGVPYDGANPEYWDLYHEPLEKTLTRDNLWYTDNPKMQRQWYERIRELIDNYHPDLLYTDGWLPFANDVGRSMIAHYYNQGAKHNKNSVVYTCKENSDGRWVQDYERSSSEGIREYPWQTDTSIGDWFYRTGQEYMSGDEVIQMLVDIVSKNGNLLLNVVQTPEGDLEPDVISILEKIAAWMEINSEAIYGSRPWEVYGEGPSMENPEKSDVGFIKGGVKDVRQYQGGDLRFTVKGRTLYIFSMAKTTGSLRVASLGLNAPASKKIKSIRLLGSKAKIRWTQNADGAVITLPTDMPDFATAVFEVKL